MIEVFMSITRLALKSDQWVELLAPIVVRMSGVDLECAVFQVFSWGSNSCGQLGHMESPSTIPRLAKVRRPNIHHPFIISQLLSYTGVLVGGACFNCNGEEVPSGCLSKASDCSSCSPPAVGGDPGVGHERRRETHAPAGRWRLHPAHHLLQRTAGERGGAGGEGGELQPSVEPARAGRRGGGGGADG